MGTDILKVAGAVAGIGGIAIGTLLLIFREVIRKNIFSTLTKSDSYRLMWWILILV
jgi:nitrate reductase gamma subunit